MTSIIPISITVIGLLTFLLSLPLMFRKVPMNKVYGIRLARAFESEQYWYDINAYGGRQMAAWSWLTTITGVTGFFVPAHSHSYVILGTAVVLLAILIPMIRICIWSKNYSPALRKS